MEETSGVELDPDFQIPQLIKPPPAVNSFTFFANHADKFGKVINVLQTREKKSGMKDSMEGALDQLVKKSTKSYKFIPFFEYPLHVRVEA